ncbi:MAG: hypothetical protein WC783_02820 [Candidatus Paceibacterota bacterium]|jgi:plastocyanin domain-containing protein
MNKNVSLIIILALVAAFFILFSGGDNDSNVGSANNVEIRDGVQYVKVDAGRGYSPKISIAQAGIPTKLIMSTSGTFDCSSALVIKSVNYQNILPPNGETEIYIGTWKTGETMQGLCSMGMYNFQVRFN